MSAQPVDVLAGEARIEPAAWVKQDTIREDNGRPIGDDEPRIVYGSENPDPGEGWAPLYFHPSNYAPTDEILRSRLQRVASTLDHFLGDTDPDTNDLDDEGVRWEYPIFWCCQQLNLITQSIGHPVSNELVADADDDPRQGIAAEYPPQVPPSALARVQGGTP